MSAINGKLQQLVHKARACPPRTIERQRHIQEIYRLIIQSGKLWQENTPYYGDAFQDTWEYCCQRLDEYDSERSSFITWVDNHLKWKLKEWRRQQLKDKERCFRSLQVDDVAETSFSPLDSLVVDSSINDAEPIWHATLDWVKADSEGKLTATCFRRRPEINAKTLFLKRFPSETPWSDIAKEFKLTASEAKDLPKFYNRKCLPLLRDFGTTQGYLD